jgi:hypothetical protein
VGLYYVLMDSLASEVYHLAAEELRQACLERGLDSGGPVRVLRPTLADHIKRVMLEPSGNRNADQVIAQ